MKTTIKFITVLFLIITTTSCFIEGVRGNRNVVTENRKITSDFDAIKVSQGIDVYLTTGGKTFVSLEADENLHELIITEVKDGELHIYSEKNIRSSKARKVYVTTPTIHRIVTTSGADVISENTIKSDELKISATSGSNVTLQLNVEELTCTTTSGAYAKLEGKATNSTVKATSGSDIKAQELETKICIAKATSGASIYINAMGSLEAKATSGGHIKYIGNPKKIQKTHNSGGSISHK